MKNRQQTQPVLTTRRFTMAYVDLLGNLSRRVVTEVTPAQEEVRPPAPARRVRQSRT